MRKLKPRFKVRRHPEPTRERRWACVDTSTGDVVGSFKFRANAVSFAGLAESVQRESGSIY